MSIQEKIKETAQKAKLAAEEAKNNATGEDGKISIDTIKASDNKTKGILAGGVAAVLLVGSMLFGGGGHSGSLSDLSKTFPADGSATEQCETLGYLRFSYNSLINDGESASNIIKALNKGLGGSSQRDIMTMTGLKREYYLNLESLIKSTNVAVQKFEVKGMKDSKLDFSRYESKIDKCIEKLNRM